MMTEEEEEVEGDDGSDFLAGSWFSDSSLSGWDGDYTVSFFSRVSPFLLLLLNLYYIYFRSYAIIDRDIYSRVKGR